MQEHAGMNKHVYLYIYIYMYICIYVCVCVDSIYVFVCCQVVDYFQKGEAYCSSCSCHLGAEESCNVFVLSVRSVFIIMSRGSSRSVEPPPYFK